MKRIGVVVFGIVCLIGVALITFQAVNQAPEEREGNESTETAQSALAEPARPPAGISSQLGDSENPELSPVDVGFQEDTVSLVQKHPTFRGYVTPSSRAIIKDSDGRVVFEASQETPFLGLKSFEGGQFLAINVGDGHFRVVNLETGEHQDIPNVPPGIDAVGFGTWEWTEATRLVGVSGVPFTGEQTSQRCCNQHVVARSLLFEYDVETNSLRQIDLPEAVEDKVFTLGRIGDGGYIELISTSGHGDDGESLGWFQLTSNT